MQLTIAEPDPHPSRPTAGLRCGASVHTVPRLPLCLQLLLLGLLCPAPITRATESSWAEQLAHPSPAARILKIIHGWPDASEAQDALIAQLQKQGFGGLVCNVSFDQYLESDEKWRSFIRAVSQAKKAGMKMWLYDERGYPSGNAGGIVLRDHPEWQARGLLVANQEVGAGPVDLPLPPGQPFLLAAFPVRDGGIHLAERVDLSAQVRDGHVRWEAPAGRWQVMAITESALHEGTHADGNLWQKMPYVNLLMSEPTARFVEVTHQRYAEKLGPDLGKTFEATFTDEPSLMSCFLKPMPYRPLPWAPNLPVEFKRRRGYALDTSVIPSLVTDTGPEGTKHRYDFWLTVGELVSANYFGQIQTWGRQHNVPSGGHLLMEESLTAHVPLYGDFFRCARRMDAPGIDCLTSLPPEVPWYIARLLASAAELGGHELVMCETSDHGQVYRPEGDKRPKRVVTEAEIRGTCNRLMAAGINRITSYYSFTDLSTEQLVRINEWVGRCCERLRGGHQVADVALVYPVESIWTRFFPAHVWANEAPGATRIENLYRAAAETLFAAQRDFTVVDSATLAGAKVEHGVLVHGSSRWRAVVLPGVDTLPMAAWSNLARFLKGGGVVIALGARPANSATEFPSARVAALGDEMFGPPRAEPRVVAHGTTGAAVCLPAGSEGLLGLTLDGLLDHDVRVAGVSSPLRVTHRRIDGEEVYFVVNDGPRAWSGGVDFAASGHGAFWDPASGHKLGGIESGNVDLSLEPYGAVLARFDRAVAPPRHPAGSGPLPNLSLRALKPTEPANGHGEFVKAALTHDAAHSHPDDPAWLAGTSLTKGGVDTFNFVSFRDVGNLSLADGDCVVVDTWVPEGQTAATQILVILADEHGVDFLASSGRSLAAPGHERSFLPLRQFQRAGWSTGGDGVLDPKKIRAVSVGWGGYLGKEGEQVNFSLALPKFGSVASPGR